MLAISQGTFFLLCRPEGVEPGPADLRAEGVESEPAGLRADRVEPRPAGLKGWSLDLKA